MQVTGYCKCNLLHNFIIYLLLIKFNYTSRCITAKLENSLTYNMSEIDEHIIKRYEIKKRLGKGVSP